MTLRVDPKFISSDMATDAEVAAASTDDRNRANHTGTQLASTISDFTSAVQAVTIDASKIDGGTVSNAEFATLDGINTGTSIQSQIDGKENTITGAATSILALDLTPSKVVTSDASGKITNSSVSTTTLGYLDATSSVQTQLNGKEPSITAGTTAQYFRGDKTFQTLDKTAVGLGNVDNVSAANLRDRTTHTGNESTLSFSEVARPSAPASGATIHVNGNFGRQMFGAVPKVGRFYEFQPMISDGRIVQVLPQTGAAAISSFGIAAPTAQGTATARAIATTSSYTWQRRVAYLSAATANSAAGIRTNTAAYGLGNVANTGGFHFVARFGISDAALVANARTFVGLTSSTGAFGNVDPSTIVNSISIGNDSADTNLQIMHNGSAGAATKINLGANFPANTVSTDMYEVSFYCAPNTTTIYYYVVNLRTGNEASGTITDTAKLPSTTTLLTWQVWRHNGGTAAAVAIDIGSVYIETDY